MCCMLSVEKEPILERGAGIFLLTEATQMEEVSMKNNKIKARTEKQTSQSESRTFEVMRRKGIVIEKRKGMNTSSTQTKIIIVFKNQEMGSNFHNLIKGTLHAKEP